MVAAPQIASPVFHIAVEDSGVKLVDALLEKALLDACNTLLILLLLSTMSVEQCHRQSQRQQELSSAATIPYHSSLFIHATNQNP